MDKNIKEILKEADQVLGLLENGKIYPSVYVVERFQKAASQHSTDQLIGNMRDVLVKVSSKHEFISQKQLGKLYDEMYGLSGGQTAFRDLLGDLLPENRQFAKVAYSGSSIRTMEENKVDPIYKESELSDAFSVLFSLGESAAFGTYKPAQDKSVQKAVIAKLSSLGYAPLGVDIIQANEHYTLCAANYQTSNAVKVSAFIPVQTTNGVTKEPQFLVLGENVVELDARNLFTCFKEQERNLKNPKKIASQRGSGEAQLEMRQQQIPSMLKEMADLDTNLIAAASKFNANQVKMAIEMLNGELLALGIRNSGIKVSGSDKTGLVLDAYIPTKLGKSVIHVPVEIHNNIPILPSKFATDIAKNNQKIYDFSKSGFESFASSLEVGSETLKVARETGELSKMSYQELMDQIISGVSSEDYKIAEDALQTIAHRFGNDQFKVAFDYFSQLLKYSSDGSSRQEFIKAAFERGDLIKVPTSVELYCPKLGLPVSKITFDEIGRVIPKGRRAKADQLSDAAISTSRIVLT